ncbi:MAG: FAD-binding protein [Alphaproteobacteria bacterium]|nr:FAD-binding protein [Alphaproteobacteria bacterium]
MALDQSLIEALRALLGERFSTATAVRDQHGRDESWHTPEPPDAVAFAESTEEVAAIVRLCAASGVPVIPFGTGTSLEGHVMARKGGVTIDLMRMNRVLEVRPQDMDVTVQAGVTRKQLNEWVRDTGLFFPVDPGADASLGGMAATRASGTSAVRYGTMRENVLNMTVVLADGQVIRTARRARKSAAGYDLTRLMVGSEGTLGVITEVTLRLHGIPEAVSAAVCAFPDLVAAVDTVIATIQAGVPVARIELLDAVMMGAVNAHAKLDYPVRPTLFFEFHGSASGVAEQAATVETLAGEMGGLGFQWATRPEDRTRLWQARHEALWAGLALRPGAKAWTTDVCVPISALADCIDQTRKDADALPFPSGIVGHVGDGNFHVLYMIDPADPAEVKLVEEANDRLVARALDMDGTCTGEHGVGYGKMRFLDAEHGPAMAAMRAVKAALDPKGIMNPGKIVWA